MATLKPGVPLTQADPLLKVDNRLEPGRHQFRLEVIDDSGLVSDPTVLTVLVTAPPEPAPAPSRTGRLDPRILTTVAREPVTRTPITPTIIRKPPTR